MGNLYRPPSSEFTPEEIRRYISARLPDVNRRQGKNELRGPCPVHKGTDPNFSINIRTGFSCCHSRCGRGWDLVGLECELTGAATKEAAKTVFQAVGRPQPNGTARASRTRIFSYTDEGGSLLYEVVRTDREGEPKRLSQRAPDGKGGHRSNIEGVRRVLYKLPEVLTAERVFIVEGEPKVELLRSWGLAATCNSGGAGKFTPEHAEVLREKRVVILPDNDDPGRKHAERVRNLCANVAAEVVTVRLPGLPPKGDIVDWARAGHTKEELLALVNEARQSAEQQKPEPPASQEQRHCESEFVSNDSGLYLVPKERKGENTWIAPPLSVIARTRDFGGDGAGVLVEFTTWEGARRRRILPLKALMGEGREGLEVLLDSGYQPKRARSCFDRVKDFIYATNPNQWVRITERTGMHGRSFVFPDRSIGPEGSEEVLFFSGEPVPHRYHYAGTLEEWRENIGQLCRGNTRLLLAVSAAFVGPLLPLLRAQSFGLHLRATSSKGKTTALLVAGSVWGGDPETGYLDTWKSTSSGLELKASLHNHSLLTLDEIALASPDEVGEAVYALCNGTGKLRANRTLTARASVQFTLVFLSSGERGLSEYLRSAGKVVKGGQDVRLIEITADAGTGKGIFEQVPPEFENPAKFANALKERSRRYYGTAIEAFLRQVTNNLDEVTVRTTARRSAFIRENVREGDSGEVWRAAETFGLIAAAGELATAHGVTGWDEGEATLAAEACFHSWIEERGGTGARDIEQGIRAVRTFIFEHGNSRFQQLVKQHPSKEVEIRNRVGFREATGVGTTYYVLPDKWHDELCRGFDGKEIASAMATRGYLERKKGKHLTIRKTLPEIGYTRVFGVLPSLFDDGQDDAEEGNASPETVICGGRGGPGGP